MKSPLASSTRTNGLQSRKGSYSLNKGQAHGPVNFPSFDQLRFKNKMKTFLMDMSHS